MKTNKLLEMQTFLKSLGYKETTKATDDSSDIKPDEYVVETFEATNEIVLFGEKEYISFIFDSNGDFVEHSFNN